MSQTPSLGRIVIFTSKIGDGVESPAVILRTAQDTIDLPHDAAPVAVAAHDPSVTHEKGTLPDDIVWDLAPDRVDLLVHGLGRDYREYNVPFADGIDAPVQPGTWHWPILR